MKTEKMLAAGLNNKYVEVLGDTTILDGSFTASQLRVIADEMDDLLRRKKWADLCARAVIELEAAKKK